MIRGLCDKIFYQKSNVGGVVQAQPALLSIRQGEDKKHNQPHPVENAEQLVPDGHSRGIHFAREYECVSVA